MKDLVFHGWNEWLINLLLLFYVTEFDLLLSVKNFLIGYIAFISFYEIGYIVNDFYSIKKEKAPRLRFGSAVNKSVLSLWVLVRLLIFLAISYYFDFSIGWLIFYAALGVAFALHNLLASSSLKTFTFLQLAIFRFWAPVFMFIPQSYLLVLFPVIILYYVFNRTLTYMDSKSLLQLPERTTINFKLNSSLILLSFILFWSYFVHSWICAAVAVYFTAFWVCIKVLGRRFSSSL